MSGSSGASLCILLSALQETGNIKIASDVDGWHYRWLSWPSCQALLAANFELCVQLDVHWVGSSP